MEKLSSQTIQRHMHGPWAIIVPLALWIIQLIAPVSHSHVHGAWWQLAAAAVSAIGGYLASRQANKKSGAEKTIEGTLASNVSQSSPYGLDMLRGSAQNYKTYQDWNEKLGRGDYTSVNQLLNPTFAQGQRQAQSAMGAQLSSGGVQRGGGAAEGRLGLFDSLQNNRQNAMLGLRSSAMDNIGLLGAQMGSTGTGILGMGNSGGNSLLGNILNRNQQGFNQGRDAGGGIFNMLSGVDWGSMFGGSKGGNNATSSAINSLGSGSGSGGGTFLKSKPPSGWGGGP